MLYDMYDYCYFIIAVLFIYFFLVEGWSQFISAWSSKLRPVDWFSMPGFDLPLFFFPLKWNIAFDSSAQRHHWLPCTWPKWAMPVQQIDIQTPPSASPRLPPSGFSMASTWLTTANNLIHTNYWSIELKWPPVLFHK